MCFTNTSNFCRFYNVSLSNEKHKQTGIDILNKYNYDIKKKG